MFCVRSASSLLLIALVSLAGCSEPSCPQGELAAEWNRPPLAGLVPSGVHVCEMSPQEGATHARFWVDTRVHDANMDNVDRCQGSGWNRTGDNWYDTTGDFDTPKWSEFSGPGGALRLDVREDGGGAMVDLVFTPSAAAAGGPSDLDRMQAALRAANIAKARTGRAARPSAPALDGPLSVPATAGRRGGENAAVVVHVFVDYQGPFDARYAPNLDQLLEEYGDRVQVVMRNNPLPFHRDAPLAAQAALAVRAQLGDDAFWRYQATLFENHGSLGRADLVRYASALDGFDAARFSADLDSATYEAAVQADIAEAARASVRGTPATLVGTQLIMGAQPYPRLREAVEAALGG